MNLVTHNDLMPLPERVRDDSGYAPYHVAAMIEMMEWGLSFEIAAMYVYRDPRKPDTWLGPRGFDA